MANLVPIQEAQRLASPGLTGINRDLLQLVEMKRKTDIARLKQETDLQKSLGVEAEKQKKALEKEREEIGIAAANEMDREFKMYANNYRNKKIMEEYKESFEKMPLAKKFEAITWFRANFPKKVIAEGWRRERQADAREKVYGFYSKKHPKLFNRDAFEAAEEDTLFFSTPREYWGVVKSRNGGLPVKKAKVIESKKPTISRAQIKSRLERELAAHMAAGKSKQEASKLLKGTKSHIIEKYIIAD